MADALRAAKYSAAVVDSPSKVTESKGWKALLEEIGLTESLVATSLVDDIREKPQQRVQELKLAAEILGMNKNTPEPSTGNTFYIQVHTTEARNALANLDAVMKSQLLNAGTDQEA